MAQVNGKEVGRIGFGLMGMTWRNPAPPVEQSFKAMKAALATGSNFWNGGEFYGPPEFNSLHLLNQYFTKYPEDADKVLLSIKGGCKLENIHPDGSREGVQRSIEQCLKILDGKKFLDIFECARVDPNVPIEETIGYIAEYVKAGKVGGISLSECNANTIRRAAKVHPIACVEVEFSLYASEILENGIAEACGELNIPIVAYSPLGRGFLTGAIKKFEDLPEGDFRRHMPRFQPDAFGENLKLTEEVEHIAQQKGVTPAQVSLAWVLAHSRKNGLPEIIPIPGATTEARVLENNKQVKLSEQEVLILGEILKRIEIKGGRYPPEHGHLLNG
ncbi:NADP-dependent oxidoreductase domain-containing protein [Phyllosticta citricarpa]|uniref:NADP-dependent oxidoreductase domain-containing protein n=1 Tax=Phyllosticta paracitricarpa TaxID=2016321 RepID=A0ABR1NJU9_9PEZI